MDNEQLKQLLLFADKHGNLFAAKEAPEGLQFDFDKAAAYMETWEWVANLNSVSPEWRNLISASLLLYRVVDEQQGLIDKLIEILEQHGADALVGPLQGAMSSMSIAKRVAHEGLEKVFPSQK